jgi:hypothetical protein
MLIADSEPIPATRSSPCVCTSNLGLEVAPGRMKQMGSYGGGGRPLNWPMMMILGASQKNS